MEYSKFDVESGKHVQVYELNKCLESIRIRNEDNEKRIKYLEEENRRLKEEYSKDEEIKKMQQKLDKMKKDYYRGFPITEEQKSKIDAWIKKHDEEVHGIKNDIPMKTGGGSYSYVFLPTSIGVSGVVECSCGAEFEFQELG